MQLEFTIPHCALGYY